MSDIGRARRWRRFLHPASARALIVPVDHGLTLGPIDGLDRLDGMRRWLASGELTGVVMHKGMVEHLGGAAPSGLIVQLNGAVNAGDPVQTVAPSMKMRLTTVQSAVALGADAVSVHLDMGGQWGSHYLHLLGEVVDEAHALGVPVLAMLYDKTPGASGGWLPRQRHFMRAAVEVGADVLKIQPPSELALLPQVLDGFEDARVLFAGGELRPARESLGLARAVAQHGGAGLCMGRNVFQHADPVAFLRELGTALHQADNQRAMAPRPLAEEMPS